MALLANMGDADDARAAALTAAEGVGLFRTESVFLDAQPAPGVAEQADLHEAVLVSFGNRPVTVRTLDTGATVKVMAPMIATSDQARAFAKAVRACVDAAEARVNVPI